VFLIERINIFKLWG